MPLAIFSCVSAFAAKDKIALCQAIDLVRPDLEPDFAPGEEDVGVMALLFRELPYPNGEVERLPTAFLLRLRSLTYGGAPKLFSDPACATSNVLWI